jgi:hypothetical protein
MRNGSYTRKHKDTIEEQQFFMLDWLINYTILSIICMRVVTFHYHGHMYNQRKEMQCIRIVSSPWIGDVTSYIK